MYHKKSKIQKIQVIKQPINGIIQEENTTVYERTPLKSYKNNSVITLKNLHFIYKSYKLDNQSVKLLKPIAQHLRTHPHLNLEVSGYTDNIGSASYNQKLSHKRANAIKQEFIHLNVNTSRIIAIGRGESNPIATNRTSQGRQLNRRVEFMFIKR